MPIVLQKTFTDGPTSWSWKKLLSVGATVSIVLKSTGSTRSISGLYTASTGSILRFCTADCACAPSIAGFDTAGTAYTLGSVLLILPLLAAFGPSVLLILPVLAVFRPPVFQYSQYSEYETYSKLRVYSEYDAYWKHLCTFGSGGMTFP